MPHEIHRADATYRRRMLLVVALCILAGAGLLEFFRTLVEWAIREPDLAAERLAWVAASLLIPALPMLLLGRSIWRTGQQSVDNRRFPPPGMKVVLDTRVLRAERAVRRGRLMQWSANGLPRY